jgi:cyclic pyranopterin phosphate synthase
MRRRPAGLKIKINAVALRGVNDHEFEELIRWSHGRGMDLVLIEVMPMGEIGDQARLDQYLPLSLARDRDRRHFTLDESDYRTGGPARYFTVGRPAGGWASSRRSPTISAKAATGCG